MEASPKLSRRSVLMGERMPNRIDDVALDTKFPTAAAGLEACVALRVQRIERRADRHTVWHADKRTLPRQHQVASPDPRDQEDRQP